MAIERDEFFRAMDKIEAGLSGIHERLDRQNGRLRDAETDLAVLKDNRTLLRALIGGAWAGLLALGGWLWSK